MPLQSFSDSIAWLRNPYAVLDRMIGRNEFSFILKLAGVGRVLVTGEPQLIAEAVRNPDLVGGRGTRALRPVVGENAMIVSEGAAHREHRALIAPFFTSAQGARHAQLVAVSSQHVVATISKGQGFAALPLFHAANLACIVAIVFGALEAQRRQQLVAVIDAYVRSLEKPWWLFLRRLQRPWLPTWGRFQTQRQALRVLILDTLQQAEADSPAGVVARAVHEARLSEAHAVDAVLEILLFGHDTAAAALAWWLGWLCAHPEAYQRAEAEARQGDEDSFIAATIQESLRLSPVVVHLTRVAARATRLGRFDLTEGEQVFLCAYLAQRHPTLWEQPAHYRPERFLDHKPAWTSHFPFGLGERLCVGMNFALSQMRIVAREVLRAGTFELRRGYALAPQRQLVLMVPREGLPLIRVH